MLTARKRTAIVVDFCRPRQASRRPTGRSVGVGRHVVSNVNDIVDLRKQGPRHNIGIAKAPVIRERLRKKCKAGRVKETYNDRPSKWPGLHVLVRGQVLWSRAAGATLLHQAGQVFQMGTRARTRAGARACSSRLTETIGACGSLSNGYMSRLRLIRLPSSPCLVCAHACRHGCPCTLLVPEPLPDSRSAAVWPARLGANSQRGPRTSDVTKKGPALCALAPNS